MEKFKALNVSSKFAICGLPLRVDSYKTCSFNCVYCFANHRKIMEFKKELQVADIKSVSDKLHKIYDEKDYDKTSFLDMLLRDRITWHYGGMSDPFQPIEKDLQITMKMVDVANWYDVSILFSTKSDTYYNCSVNPDKHSFQLSITNLNNDKRFEPNVPDINQRILFYKKLKDEGFKVGIRIQPFIPKVSSEDIVDYFRDADYFTIEGLKLVPQNKKQKETLYRLTGLTKNDFIQEGLLNLKPHIRKRLYAKLITRLEQYNLPYSIADNDMHHISKSRCCCGANLVKKHTNFNNTTLLFDYNCYSFDFVNERLGDYSYCKANDLFTSNRQEGCSTVSDFFKVRLKRESSPFSKKFLYGFRDDKQKTL